MSDDARDRPRRLPPDRPAPVAARFPGRVVAVAGFCRAQRHIMVFPDIVASQAIVVYRARRYALVFTGMLSHVQAIVVLPGTVLVLAGKLWCS